MLVSCLNRQEKTQTNHDRTHGQLIGITIQATVKTKGKRAYILFHIDTIATVASIQNLSQAARIAKKIKNLKR